MYLSDIGLRILQEHMSLVSTYNELTLDSFTKPYLEKNYSDYIDDPNQLSTISKIFQFSIDNKFSIYEDVIKKCLEVAQSHSNSVGDLNDFYSKIVEYPNFENVRVIFRLYGDNVVTDINPDYLIIFTDTMARNIDKMLKGDMSSDDIKAKFLTDYYKSQCKQRLATTKISSNDDLKSIVKKDFTTSYQIGKEIIRDIVLPILDNYSVNMNILNNDCTKTILAIDKSNDIITDILNTLKKYKDANKIDNATYNKLNIIVIKYIKLYFDLCAYLTFVVTKKINTLSFNISTLERSKSDLLKYFPDGVNILHESVMTGTDGDIETDDTIRTIDSGNDSILQAILANIMESNLDKIEYYSNRRVNMEAIKDTPYKNDIYELIQKNLDALRDKVNKFVDNYNDGMSLEDNIDEFGLKANVEEMYPDLVDKTIANVEYYDKLRTTIGKDKYSDFICMLLHEILDQKNNVGSTIIKSISDLIDFVNEFYFRVRSGTNVGLEEIYNEEKLGKFLDDVLAMIHNVEVLVVNSLTTRYSNIDKLLKNVIEEKYSIDYGELTTDIEDAEFTNNLLVDTLSDINDTTEEINVIESMRLYRIARERYLNGTILTEALATNPNADNNTNAPQNNQDKQKLGDLIKNFIKKIQEFFGGNANKLRAITQDQSGNLKWLQDNKATFTTRNYSNDQVSILPYYDNPHIGQILGDFDKVINTLNTLNTNAVKNLQTPQQVNAYLFKSILGEQNTNVPDVSKIFPNYYSGDTSGNNRLKQYSGNDVGKLVNQMFDFCITAYSTGFNDIANKNDTIQKILQNKFNPMINMTESVNMLFEADGNTNSAPTDNSGQAVQNVQQSTTTNNNQQNTNNKQTTPDVKKGDNQNQNNQNNNQQNNEQNKKTSTNDSKLFNIIKWITSSVEIFSAAAINGYRNCNFDSLKVIDKLK